MTSRQSATSTPVGVLPEYQRRGIGSRLIESGNSTVHGAGYPFIIVIGHPAYYARFGFQPASTLGISCEWDVPEGACLLLPLDVPRMRDVAGVAKYREEFSTVA